jgi:hypothetical protein
MLTTTIVAPPSKVSKWQMGFNSAFKGLIRFHYRVRDLLSKQNSRCLLVEERNFIKQVGMLTDKEFSLTAVPTYRSLRVSNFSLVHSLSNSPICNTKVFKVFCIVMESLCFATASANRSLL